MEVILFVDDGYMSYSELVYYDSPPPPSFLRLTTLRSS